MLFAGGGFNPDLPIYLCLNFLLYKPQNLSIMGVIIEMYREKIVLE